MPGSAAPPFFCVAVLVLILLVPFCATSSDDVSTIVGEMRSGVQSSSVVCQAGQGRWSIHNDRVGLAVNPILETFDDNHTAFRGTTGGSSSRDRPWLEWLLFNTSDGSLVAGPNAFPRLEFDAVAGASISTWKFLEASCTTAIQPAADADVSFAGDGNGNGEDEAVLAITQLGVAAGNGGADLKVTRFFQVFANFSFVRTWAEVAAVPRAPASPSSPSSSEQTTTALSFLVRGCELLDVTFVTPNDSVFHFFHVEQWDGSFDQQGVRFAQRNVAPNPGIEPLEIRMGSFPGASAMSPSSAAWFAMSNVMPGHADPLANQTGAVVGIEFNGKMRVRSWVDGGEFDGKVRVTMETLNHTIGLGSDGPFVWPAVFIGLFEGDWDEAGFVTQRFAEAHISPPLPDDNYPYCQYDSWSYGLGINETNQLQALDVAHELGLEVFVLDLGWATQIGEWRADPSKFPNGLAPLVKKAHGYAMKFGLHLPLAQVSPLAPIMQQHPDWVAFPLNPIEPDYFGATALCLGNQPAREWLIQQVLSMIDLYDIDYIVQDGEDMVKRCLKDSHTHNVGDFNYANSEQGVDVVIAAIRRAHPNFVLENCEDGGAMLTFKVAGLYDTSISCDNDDAYTTRQGVYGQSYYFSPRYSARYYQDPPSAYGLRSSMFGGPLILQQSLSEWNASTVNLTKRFIDEYKRYRSLIRESKVYHLLPQGGYGWDAIEAMQPDRSAGVVFVYRAVGGTDSKVIPVKGLAPASEYAVTFVDGKTTYSATGSALMRDGIKVALPELASEIIELKRL